MFLFIFNGPIFNEGMREDESNKKTVGVGSLHITGMQSIWRTKQNKFSLLGIEISSHVKKSYCSVLQIGCIFTDMQGVYHMSVKPSN